MAATTSASEERLQATVILRPIQGTELAGDLAAMASALPGQRKYLSPAQFAARYGASTADIDKVTAFAKDHDLEVTAIHQAGRAVEVSGTEEAFNNALSVSFEKVRHLTGLLRRPTKPVAPPRDLRPVIEGIFGLDQLPLFQRLNRGKLAAPTPDTAVSSAKGTKLSPQEIIHEVAASYRFPKDADGTGERVAVILLGGGFYPEDMKKFLGKNMPEITVECIGEATNDPAPQKAVHAFLECMAAGKTPSGDPAIVEKVWWTIEATADLQLVASFAPGAKITAYFAENSEKGKIDAMVAALTQTEQIPTVISCSWGMRECDAHPPYLHSIDRLFQLAALQGISICYSSGDSGADLSAQGVPRVHFPASSPHVLACGGTRLAFPKPNPEDQISWDESRGSSVLATGGGFSNVFSRPAWQTHQVSQPGGRGVPDVAGKADYASGYHCLLAGRAVLGGGTSVAAPMWAALLARISQKIGHRVGWLSPLLYRKGADGCLEDVQDGDNGHYSASDGWDPCTGLGTPTGDALIKALSAS